MQQNIAFLGAGNMAQAFIGGLIANGWNPKQLWATGPHLEKLQIIQKQFGLNISENNQIGTQAADIIVLAVKPALLKTVAMEIAAIVQKKQSLVISVATGVRLIDLQHWVRNDTAIVRCMPNTPALVRCGATALCANLNVSSEQKNSAETILRSVGITIWLNDEDQLDIVTALSGSGPAYFFRMMEALEQAATQLGLTAEMAHSLTLHTALGAARMALESKESLATLRQQITSPGGTTEQALKVLNDGDIATLFANALRAAQQRAHELGKLFGEKNHHV